MNKPCFLIQAWHVVTISIFTHNWIYLVGFFSTDVLAWSTWTIALEKKSDPSWMSRVIFAGQLGYLFWAFHKQGIPNSWMVDFRENPHLRWMIGLGVPLWLRKHPYALNGQVTWDYISLKSIPPVAIPMELEPTSEVSREVTALKRGSDGEHTTTGTEAVRGSEQD